MLSMKQDYVSKIIYFAEPGKLNTVKTLKIAREKAVQYDIKRAMVASTKS